MQQSTAQVAPERAALKAIEKKKWEKAEDRLRKIIQKDSVNVLGKYLFTLYYFMPDNPAFNVDSAYYYVIRSSKDILNASPKQHEKLRRFPLDTVMIISLRKQIDSAAFEHARLVNTEQGFLQFLSEHQESVQQNQAMELRDELAYLHAVKANTHDAFQEFLKKYPQAARASEARKKYDLLLYEAKTKDKRLESFEIFLKEYPETPFRKEIEGHIFELFTLSGEVERFLSFMQKYPESTQVKRALDIVFHILQEKEDTNWPGLFLTDSLQNIRKLQGSYLVPFFKARKFGFMDKNGIEIIRPAADEIDEVYKCGNIVEDILVLSDRVLARDGSVIYEGNFEKADDIGTGFLKIKNRSCYTVLHKSGYVIEGCATDVKVLGSRFLSILKESQWEIYTLTGRKVIPEKWEDIVVDNNIFAMKKSGKWHLVTQQHLVEMSNQQKVTLSEPFDEIKILPDGFIWVKTNNYQGVFDHALTDIIPFNKHTLTKTFFGFIGYAQEGFTIYHKTGKQASYFDLVKLNEPWVVVSKKGSAYLFNTDSLGFQSQAYDSVKFEGPFAIGIKSDSLVVHFPDRSLLGFSLPAKALFIPGHDSTSFIVVEAMTTAVSGKGKKKITTLKTLYNSRGKKLFTTDMDKIEYAGHDLFIIHKKEKKGLINSMGNMVLPIEYDAIGSVTNNVVSLLKAMKFGSYNVSAQQLIKPQYDKNLVPYTNRLSVAYKNGLYGLIDWDNKNVSSNVFEEIMYWNDTAAFVKKNHVWMLFNITLKETVESNIKEIKMIKDAPEEKVAIIRQEELYGVLSNKKGTIIPITFSDVKNIGSAEEPLYFTEKHVTEASVFVVIYYDRNGTLLRSEVYEEGDDYERIYCPDN